MRSNKDNAVEPTITPDPANGSPNRVRVEHPAFGAVILNRTSGQKFLFGSNFDHQHYITLRIRKNVLHRDLHTDWYHPTTDLIEINMSADQWATLLTSMNMGEGVPCTLNYVGLERIPDIPAPDALKLSQVQKKELLSKVTTAKRSIAGNLDFVADMFSEHVEETLESAKSEIHSYTDLLVHRTGLAALPGGSAIEPPVRMIEGNKPPTDIEEI